MADMSPTAYAFFGSGEVEPENAVALLNDELPQDYDDEHPGIGALFRPTEVPRQATGLNNVVTWLEGEFGKRFIGATDDVVAALIDRRKKHNEKVVLVAVWPDEPAKEEIDTAMRALEAGIRVKNIGGIGAMNDLDMTPYEEKPEDAADAAEAEAAMREPGESVQLAELVADEAVDQFLIGARAFITNIVIEVLESRGVIQATADKSPQAPREEEADGEKPPFDGPYKDAKDAKATGADGAGRKTKFYVDDDGRYRRAKGRPRAADKDKQTAMLTEAEVADLEAKGLVDA